MPLTFGNSQLMIKIFKYFEELQCFIVAPQYKKIAHDLGLTEWNEVVWIGRYFTLDNDYGEHWFDNWELREKVAEKAKALGFDETDLLIIDPDRFKNEKDGPCHSAGERTNFWKDVLQSLELSLETIVSEARLQNAERQLNEPEEVILDLENRIASLVASGI